MVENIWFLEPYNYMVFVLPKILLEGHEAKVSLDDSLPFQLNLNWCV